MDITPQFQESIRNELKQKAQRAGVKLSSESFASAISERASVAVAAISHEEADVASLFVVLSIPDDLAKKMKGTRIKSGAYIIDARLDSDAKKATALLMTTDRKEIGPLPASILPPHGHAPSPMASIPVSGHINWCGFGVDAHVRGIVIEVNVRWC